MHVPPQWKWQLLIMRHLTDENMHLSSIRERGNFSFYQTLGPIELWLLFVSF